MEAAAEVRCWLYDVSGLYDEATFERAMSYLPWDERRDRARRYRFQKDRALSLGAGLLAAHALRSCGARDLSMGTGEFGKPYLEQHPNIHFNLSHSGKAVLCAVADQAVGVDVEELHPYDEGLARRCYSPDELAWMNSQPNASIAFTRLWVRKESYLKLLGTGLQDCLRNFSVSPDSPAPGVSAAHKPTIFFWEDAWQTHRLSVCCSVPLHLGFELAPSGFWSED